MNNHEYVTDLQCKIVLKRLALSALFFITVADLSTKSWAQSSTKSGQSIQTTDEFWNSFKPLAGKSFRGTLQHAPEGDTTFADKELVMHVLQADDERIAIHFFVDEDRSRTWLMTKVDGRIRLKHDHRHEDGSEDEITQYGGTASNFGSANRQVFPADQETVTMLPAAAANVWWIDVEAGKHYVYNMRRLGTDRYFSVKFDLENAIQADTKAWGW